MLQGLSIRDFLSAADSLFAVSVHSRTVDVSDTFVRLADRVAAPLLDGEWLSNYGPPEAATRAVREALRAPAVTPLDELCEMASARCRAGADLFFIGEGFEPEGPLKALMRLLNRLRRHMARYPDAGRVMAAIGMPTYPAEAAVHLAFDRWLRVPVPTLDVSFPPGIELAAGVVEGVRALAGCSAVLGQALQKTVLELPQVRERRSADLAAVATAAAMLLDRDPRLIQAGRVAGGLPPDLLTLLLNHRPGSLLTAGPQLRTPLLDRLAGDGVLTWAGPAAWEWVSPLHARAMGRVRDAQQKGRWVRCWTGGPPEERPLAEVTKALLTAEYDLSVDAILHNVCVSGKRCGGASGNSRPFRLLDHFLRRVRDGAPVVSYEDFLDTVYSDLRTPTPNNVQRTASQLNTALGGLWGRIAENVYGVGYRLRPDHTVTFLYVTPLEVEHDAAGTAR